MGKTVVDTHVCIEGLPLQRQFLFDLNFYLCAHWTILCSFKTALDR